MRILCDLYMIPPSTSGDYPFTFGFMMVDADAGAAGATPDPQTDVSSPWLYWRQGHLHVRSNTTLTDFHYQIDIKARRRITTQSDLVFIAESGGMQANVDITLGGRVLLALP